MPVITYRDALNRALAEEMRRDPLVFLMGEEVGVYQGAYKVSRGLLQEFGETRVIDTPITEESFCGLGIGAAMVGLRPIIELMTWNFSMVAIDQIVNNAAKMLYMSGGQTKIPIVFRGPGGAAHQLSAQHSQSLESWYAHVPGLKVVAPSTPYDAKGLLKSAVRDDDPVIVIEGETLYGSKGEVPEDEYTVPIGVADVKRSGTDVTLLAWSKMVQVALAAAERLATEGVSSEVIDLRTIRPLDEAAILASVRRTNRCVVVEEGWPFAGVGAQIGFLVQAEAFDDLDAPVASLPGAEVPMPVKQNPPHLALPSAAPGDRAEAITKVLPSQKAPTVAHLYNSDWVSIESILPEKEVRRIVPGPEQRSLDLFTKGITVQRALGSLQMLDHLSIVADFYSLLYHPWSTLADIESEIGFLEASLPVMSTCYSIRDVCVFAGTPLAERLRAEGRLAGQPWCYSYQIPDERVELLRRMSRFVFASLEVPGGFRDRLTQAWFAVLQRQRFAPSADDGVEIKRLRSSTAGMNQVIMKALRAMFEFVSGPTFDDSTQANRVAADWAKRINESAHVSP
jgi:pyruvate dehydrogenase E1 component beta subunit